MVLLEKTLIKGFPDTPDSTSNADCYFLTETCRQKKTKENIRDWNSYRKIYLCTSFG